MAPDGRNTSITSSATCTGAASTTASRNSSAKRIEKNQAPAHPRRGLPFVRIATTCSSIPVSGPPRKKIPRADAGPRRGASLGHLGHNQPLLHAQPELLGGLGRQLLERETHDLLRRRLRRPLGRGQRLYFWVELPYHNGHDLDLTLTEDP